MRRSLLACLALCAVASPAWPCSWVGEGPPVRDALVREADVIVRARIDQPHDEPSSRAGQILIRFTVIALLKGTLAGTEVAAQGYLEDRDDFNDGPAPRDFVRPGGRLGNCYAEVYRQGAEYLLLLKHRDSPLPALRLSPYWAALRPTNEQIRGADDPWLLWVAAEVARQEILRTEVAAPN